MEFACAAATADADAGRYWRGGGPPNAAFGDAKMVLRHSNGGGGEIELH